MAKLVFVLYKHLGQFLSTENATLRGIGDLNKHNLSLTVNSHILSASITKESSRVFVADPVIFTLEHLDVSLLWGLPLDCSIAQGCRDTKMAAQGKMQDFEALILLEKLGLKRIHLYCARVSQVAVKMRPLAANLASFPFFH